LIQGPEQILALNLFTGADTAAQNRSDIRFQFLPRQSRGEHGQWVAQIDHLIKAATEKIGSVRHRQNSQKIGGKVLKTGRNHSRKTPFYQYKSMI
jgi:hypothetical protein